MSVLEMYSPYFHFLEKNFGDGADPLWGLVQLHFWRISEDRQKLTAAPSGAPY
jgi:hypothetical protein